MSQDTTEQKQFDASSQKLEKMRKRGQFAQSRNVITVIAVVIGTLYILLVAPIAYGLISEIFDIVFAAISSKTSVKALPLILASLRNMALICLPLFFAIFLAVALATGFMSKGLRFAVEPLIPKFEKVNPASGFKRLFGKKAIVDFLLDFLKVAIIVTILITVHLSIWGSLAELPRYRLASFKVVSEVILLMIAVLLAIMIVIAVIDLIIQRSIFLKDAMMTQTERKNEDKEQHGSPEMRARRDEITQENATLLIGLNLATFSLQHGPIMLAFRFVEGETDVPILVGKGTTKEAAVAMTKALPRRAANIRNPLAQTLKNTQLGHSVTSAEIGDLAGLMSQHGLY